MDVLVVNSKNLMFLLKKSSLLTQTAALMLAGLCHDLDHPGFNNNFVSLSKHPLAQMYKSSMLEYHHYYMAKKIIEVTLLKNPLLCDSFA